MTHKIWWLATLFTLVYWLGNAWGCSATHENDNYKILEEDRRMFDTDPNPATPGASEAPMDDTAQIETAASIDGIDRSNWSRITIAAETGAVTRHPVYFKDLHMDPAANATGPMDHPDNAGLDKTNTVAVLAQPLKFAWDIASLPYHMITDPPVKQQLRVPGEWSSSEDHAAPASAEPPTMTQNVEPVVPLEQAEQGVAAP